MKKREDPAFQSEKRRVGRPRLGGERVVKFLRVDKHLWEQAELRKLNRAAIVNRALRDAIKDYDAVAPKLF